MNTQPGNILDLHQGAAQVEHCGHHQLIPASESLGRHTVAAVCPSPGD